MTIADLESDRAIAQTGLIGLMVDVTRVLTYAAFVVLAGKSFELPQGAISLVAAGILAAFSGVLIGKRYLHKVRMRWVRTLTGLLLLLIAVLVGLGII